ncbi:MAG TPA: toll/interleukin-1 receptor domain-containing protein [Longimicrobium sp.]|jgi:hypothetical protein
MPNYHVFTSYAQRDRDKHLDRFIAEFSEELRSARGAPDATRMAFFDRIGVKAGDRWSQTITDELSAADVLLCLMSPTYFTREWCGRELEVFLQRAVRLPAADARFIFPVWWRLPTAPRSLPSRLVAHHHRDADFPPGYESAGIRGLARQGRWTQFTRMVDRLVELISETLDQPHRLPTGEAVTDIAEIVNAFDEQQPYDVCMVALTPGGDAWVPSATDPSVGAAAAETAERLMVFIRRLDTGAGTDDRLQKAQDEEQVLLLVADATAAVDDQTRMINALDLPNLAVLLVDAGDPAVGVDAWVDRMPAGAFAGARAAGLIRAAGSGELKEQMERLVDAARRRLQTLTQAERVEDPDLAKSAAAQGIPIHVQPTLAAPGGEARP